MQREKREMQIAPVFWGKDFLLVNVDDGDVPVSIDLRPGSYNATQLADEVERAINDAYGDDNKLQVRSNVDDTLTVDFYTLNTGDGTLKRSDYASFYRFIIFFICDRAGGN
jgi:hypothetical protein